MNTSKTITYNDGRVTAEIETAQATVLMSMTRTRLILEADEAIKGVEKPTFEISYLRGKMYPDIIAGTLKADISIDGKPQEWPMAFEDFIQLPDALVQAWEKSVYALNAHWLGAVKDEDQEKKVTGPSKES